MIFPRFWPVLLIFRDFDRIFNKIGLRTSENYRNSKKNQLNKWFFKKFRNFFQKWADFLFRLIFLRISACFITFCLFSVGFTQSDSLFSENLLENGKIPENLKINGILHILSNLVVFFCCIWLDFNIFLKIFNKKYAFSPENWEKPVKSVKIDENCWKI